MAAFRVTKALYMPSRDLIVLAGELDSGKVMAGWRVDLPRDIRGPGWVPIHDVQHVPFADGVTHLCLVLQYEVVTSAPLMEFADLEGLALEVRP